MLISLRKKFIFVANLKTASTAIEKQLRSVCEVAILQTRFGKHHGLDEIEKRFSGFSITSGATRCSSSG